MKKEHNQLTSSRRVGMRDINTAWSAPISRITALRDDEGHEKYVGKTNRHSRGLWGISNALDNAQGVDPRLQASGMTNKNNRHAELSLLNISTALTNQGRDPEQKPFGMTLHFNHLPLTQHCVPPSPSGRGCTNSSLPHRGGRCPVRADEGGSRAFTLIELLVVILIVAILAAIAVPQYQRAVDKTRVMSVLTLGKSIQRAEELYYAAYGSYTRNYEELDLDLPVKEKIYDNQFVSTSGNRYTFYVQQPTIPASVYAYFMSHGFLLISYDRSSYKGRIVCYAPSNNKRIKAACQALTNKEPRGCAVSGYCTYDL